MLQKVSIAFVWNAHLCPTMLAPLEPTLGQKTIKYDKKTLHHP